MLLSELDQDLQNVEILLQRQASITDSMEFSNYFANLQRTQSYTKGIYFLNTQTIYSLFLFKKQVEI